MSRRGLTTKNYLIIFISIFLGILVSGCATPNYQFYQGEKRAPTDIALIKPELRVETQFGGSSVTFTANAFKVNGTRIEAPFNAAIELLPGTYELDVALLQEFSIGTVNTGGILFDAFISGLVAGLAASENSSPLGHPSKKRTLIVEVEANKQYKINFNPHVSDEITKGTVLGADFWLEEITSGQIQAQEMGKYDPKRDFARIELADSDNAGELMIRTYPVYQGATQSVHIQISDNDEVFRIHDSGESLFELDAGEYWVRASGRIDRLLSTSIEEDDRSIKVQIEPGMRKHFTYDPPFGAKSIGELFDTTDLSLADARMIPIIEGELERIETVLTDERGREYDDTDLRFVANRFSDIDIQHLGKLQYRVFAKVNGGRSRLRVGSRRMDLRFPDNDDGVEYVFSIDARDRNDIKVVIFRKTVLDYLARQSK